MRDIEVLTQANLVLDKCGRPRPPQEGLSVLRLYRGWLLQVVFPAATGSPTQTITKEITGETTWELEGIQITSSAATALSVQFLLPGGKFLVNNLQDALQIAGYGSYRYAFNPGWKCPPGTKIQVTFQVTDTTNQQPMAILFDGAYQFLLSATGQRICPVDEAAQDLPRYFSHPNQNIMAPIWQHGIAPSAPVGFKDEDFIYSALGPTSSTFPAGAPGSSISVTAANVTAIQQIQIDASEFHCQRVLIQVSADGDVTGGSILARIRTGSGYTICDDYFDVARYIGSSFFPVELIIAPNDIVYADLQLVDGTGVGNVYWTMFLDGFKRKRAA